MPSGSQHRSSAPGPARGAASSSYSSTGRGHSPEPGFQWVPVSQQVMRGTGMKCRWYLGRPGDSAAPVWGRCQIKHHWAGGRGQGCGLQAGGALSCSHGQDLLPSWRHREPIIPGTRKAISFPWGGRGRQLGAGLNKAFFSSFMLTYLHPSFPRKAWFSYCTWRPLQENAISPS